MAHLLTCIWIRLNSSIRGHLSYDEKYFYEHILHKSLIEEPCPNILSLNFAHISSRIREVRPNIISSTQHFWTKSERPALVLPVPTRLELSRPALVPDSNLPPRADAAGFRHVLVRSVVGSVGSAEQAAASAAFGQGNPSAAAAGRRRPIR